MSGGRGIDADTTIDSVMRNWPQTIRIVLEHRMLCVGCPVGRFHTVAEAAIAHQLDEHQLLQRLRNAIGDGDASLPPAALGDEK